MSTTAKDFKSHIAFVFELYRRTQQMKRVATYPSRIGKHWCVYDDFTEDGRRISLQRRDDGNSVMMFTSREKVREYLRGQRHHAIRAIEKKLKVVR